jgi:hypothetical protein
MLKSYIVVSYPVPGQFGIIAELDTTVISYMEVRGFMIIGSGSGFGRRDQEFSVPFGVPFNVENMKIDLMAVTNQPISVKLYEEKHGS